MFIYRFMLAATVHLFRNVDYKASTPQNILPTDLSSGLQVIKARALAKQVNYT